MGVEDAIVLRYSIPTVLIQLGLVAVTVLIGYLGSPLFFVISGFIVAGLISGFVNLRLDRDGMTLYSPIKLYPTQHYEWDELGPFERAGGSLRASPYGVLRSSITSGRYFRVLWLLPFRRISLSAVYGEGYSSPAFPAERLRALLESYRLAE